MCRKRTNYTWKVPIKLLGAIIDVGKGTMHLSSPPNNHIFPKFNNKSKRGKGKKFGFNASSNT